MPGPIKKSISTARCQPESLEHSTNKAATFKEKKTATLSHPTKNIEDSPYFHPVKAKGSRQIKPHVPDYKKKVTLKRGWTETITLGALKTAFLAYNAASGVRKAIFNPEAKIQKRIDSDIEKKDKITAKIKEKEKAIEDCEEKIESLKKAIKSNPSNSEEIIKQISYCHFSIRVHKDNLCGELKLLDYIEDRIKKLQHRLSHTEQEKENKVQEMIAAVSNLGITLFSRLQSAYGYLKDQKDKAVACEIEIPMIHIPETYETPFPVTITDARIVIDQCHLTPEGSFEINIARAQGKVKTNTGSNPPAIVTVSGLHLSIRPPVGKAFAAVLNASAPVLPTRIAALVKTLSNLPLPADDTSAGGMPFAFSLPHIHLANHDDDCSAHTEDTVVSAVAGLVTPAFHKVRKQFTQHLLKRSQERLENNQIDHRYKLRLHAELQNAYEKQLEDFYWLKQWSPVSEHACLEQEIRNIKYLIDHKNYIHQKLSENSQKAILTEQAISASQAFRLKQSDRNNGSSESLKNALLLFMGIRSLNQADVHQREICFPKQVFSVSDDVTAELTDTQLTVSEIETCDNGNLLVRVPHFATNCHLRHVEHGETHKASVNLKDISIIVKPPMARLLKKLVIVTFPLSIEETADVFKAAKEIDGMLRGARLQKTTKNPLATFIKDCFDISLGNARLQTPDDSWSSTEKPPGIDEVEGLALPIAEQTGIPVDEAILQKFIDNLPSQNNSLHAVIIRLLQFVFIPERVTSKDGEVFYDASDSFTPQESSAPQTRKTGEEKVEPVVSSSKPDKKSPTTPQKETETAESEQSLSSSRLPETVIPAFTAQAREYSLPPAPSLVLSGFNQSAVPAKTEATMLTPLRASNHYTYFKTSLSELFTHKSRLLKFFTKHTFQVEVAVSTQQLSMSKAQMYITWQGKGFRNRIGRILATKQLKKVFKNKELQLDYSRHSLPVLLKMNQGN